MQQFLPTPRALICLLLTLASVAGCGDRSVGSGPHMKVKLVADQDSLTPGSTFTLGVVFQPEPGWHIYWKNPGDSGLAPKFAWESSGGILVDAPLWPYPERISVGPLINYGHGEILLPFPARFSVPPPRASSTSVTLSLQWLVCKEECLPGEAQLELSFPIKKVPAPPSIHAKLFDDTLQKLPQKLDRVSVAIEEQQDHFIIALIPFEPRFFPSVVTFFPEDPRVIVNSAPQEISLEGGALRVSLKRDPNRREPLRRVRGVLFSSQGWSETGEPKAILIDSNPDDQGALDNTSTPASTSPLGSTSLSEESALGFFAAVIFAFLGGILLNIMPCVFPVLSIKILGFIEQAGQQPRKIKMHGIAFSAGVIASFWVFATIFIALRAGGEQIGWGFQLQSPACVAIMAFIFFILGLLFLSDISLGASVQRLAGRARLSADYTGSFANGVLATAVATPCTGPLMGSALAATLTLPAIASFFVFTALGLGMSFPYLVIAYKPQLLNRLPRPGAWMESFKQFMAFPLFATVVWLTRVFARQMGLEGQGLNLLSDMLWGTLAVAVSFWALCRAGAIASKLLRRTLQVAAIALAIGGIAMGTPSSSEIDTTRSKACIANEENVPEPDEYGLIWMPYSEQKLASLLSQGRSVYLDFTAEWCITCQVNKRLVFSSSQVRALIVQKNVALMR